MSDWDSQPGRLFFWMICTHHVYESEQEMGHTKSVSLVYMLAVSLHLEKIEKRKRRNTAPQRLLLATAGSVAEHGCG